MKTKTRPSSAPGTPRRVMVKRKDRDLSFRAPLLERGHATFEGILDATATLLEQSGIESVTTNHVARAAGINVATLYHYFPNKLAILVALFERQTHRRATAARDAISDLRPGAVWRQTIDAAIDSAVRLRLSEPGVVALRMAMRANLQLQVYDRADSLLVSRVIADRIVAAGTAQREEADVVALCCVETIGALLDVWQLDSGGRDDSIIVQLKRMVERFVAPYLDQPVSQSVRSRR